MRTTISIPMLDLKAQCAPIREELAAAIAGVLDSGHYVLGPDVVAFEEEFAEYCGAQWGIAVNSGTSALHLALLAAGVGPGDEVITVPMTFVATAAAIGYTGARPVFVDVHPDSYTMDPACIESAITARTKAIVPVHLYGQPADMDPILDIARRRNLKVIEDAAQAHGAEYKGRRAGSMGDFGCFSFYPGKNLGACGEGGMVVCSDAEACRAMRMLRDWGAERKYEHVLKGFNYRMEGIQGAVLRVKLRRLEAWTEARRTNAGLYRRALAGSGLELPREMPYARHVYHVFAVRLKNRSDLYNQLTTEGIQCGIHYPTPVHLLPAYADLGHRRGDFPVSESIAAEELSLPLYPEMTPAQISQVAQSIRENVGAQVDPFPATAESAYAVMA